MSCSRGSQDTITQQLVHEVRGGQGAGHQVHVDGGAGEGRGGRVGGGLRGRDGTRIEVQVAHFCAEVRRRRTVHGHGTAIGVLVLLLNLDWFGHVRVLVLLVALQLAL